MSKINRALFTDTTAQVLAAADGNDFKTANAKAETVLNAMMASPSYLGGDVATIAFVDELKQVKENCNSAVEYRGGGRAKATEKQSYMSAQRVVTSKSSSSALYQNESSSRTQKTFASKKGGFF